MTSYFLNVSYHAKYKCMINTNIHYSKKLGGLAKKLRKPCLDMPMIDIYIGIK